MLAMLLLFLFAFLGKNQLRLERQVCRLIALTFHLNFVLVSPFLARESAHIEAKPACSEFFEGEPHAIALVLI